MNKPLDINALQSFEDAVATYEKLSAERKKAHDHAKKNEISVQINTVLQYISKKFKTKKADIFLLERAPPASAASKNLWSYGIRSEA